MTVNSLTAPDLSVARTASLLERLTGTLSSHAQAAEVLTREQRVQRLALERRRQEALTLLDQRTAQELEALDSVWVGRWENTRWHHEQRMLRIEKAERNCLRDLPRRTESARADWLGGIQRDRIAMERGVLSSAAAAVKQLERLSARLDEARPVLEKQFRDARALFQGSPGFQRLLNPPPGPEAASPEAGKKPFDAATADTELAGVERTLADITGQLESYRRRPLPRLFSAVNPAIPAMILIAAAVTWAGISGFKNQDTLRLAGLGAAGGLLVLAVIYFASMKAARPAAAALAQAIAQGRRITARLRGQVDAAQSDQHDRMKLEQDKIADEMQAKRGTVDSVGNEFSSKARRKISTQTARISARNENIMNAKRDVLEAGHSAESAALQEKLRIRREALTAKQAVETAALAAASEDRWKALEKTWQDSVPGLFRSLEEIGQAAAAVPMLSTAADWTPPSTFAATLPFAQLMVDLEKHAGALPHTPRLPLPADNTLHLPLSLTFPLQGSLILQTSDPARGEAAEILNLTILRLLASCPPGKASFTILDPVGLGQNFAGLMNLSDYEDSLINHRIWTQRDQIEDRLATLSAHIEKVIQMYLRNEYATISEYNAQAGSVAEKYHFLVIADYPANFSESAVKRLESIIASGPRCGVFTLMHTNLRTLPPEENAAVRQRPDCVILRQENGVWTLPGMSFAGVSLTFLSPPPPDRIHALLHAIGRASVDSGRVQVPFSAITPQPEDYWKNDTTQELRIAIGRTGATKQQILAIGKGTRQHALFAGKTGSGKSTIFHVIITNLALSCSPDQVEFYLIDFKKGVEFKCYATKRLPHARVVAIESDREFALSVLQRLDEELKRRGDRFRQLGVQDLPGWQRAGGAEPIPRTLLIIDEFQEFFVEDDTIAQTASLLLDRIVRQGRAFGIHVLLGSQTLGGAYSLARATLGQMTIRVALQCNEADAYLIMDDNNSAPRLLSRPGEGIYNDAAGSVEGNSPFQVVWLPDEERDQWLDKVQALAAKSDRPPLAPIVFEGNAPADLRGNVLLQKVLETTPLQIPAAGRCWLGAPNSIKGPTEAAFHRQSGQHLLITGQRDEATLTMLGLSLLALAAQYPAGTAKFYLFHSAAPGGQEAEFIDHIAATLPTALTQVRPAEAASAMGEISAELKTRVTGADSGEGPAAPPVFVLIHGLHRFKKLRQEDEFSFSMDSDSSESPGAQFASLITEGSSHGIHLLVSLDTYNNVNRCMNRKALTEFEMRVVFQMSANDSSSLIDSPAAGNLGLHRALFHNEHDGTLETFRPYAPPDPAWLAQATEAAARRRPAPVL
ncbi:MAG: FtsK/SpoIIIE domain-containing protein [Verrucomicrobiota bacterium]